MRFADIEFEVKNIPLLDKSFIPLELFNRAFLKTARQPLAVAVERGGGLVTVYDTFIHGTPEMAEADFYFVERVVKFLLWARGGFRVTICGDEEIGARIREAYSSNGARCFDSGFMANIYERDFEVNVLPYERKPEAYENPVPLGRHMDGCRIGFDAGGSDRKVSAVVDGNAVYSEEVVWHPKITADPSYHYNEIVAAFKTAAAHMPRVDAIGISSAGIYINNRAMAASLFLKVPKELWDEKVKDIYIRAAAEIGGVPVQVANDGDVTALAGAMSLDAVNVLGMAMGTSEAAGYVDGDGNITGWLNELAFAPVDAQPEAMRDEWSGDIGCGVKYFSQDGVIKYAPCAGIALDETLSPGEKLKAVQKLLEEGVPGVADIFKTIGCCLGHTAVLYARFYDVRHILLLGRVMSGKGGNLILSEAQRVLESEYGEIYDRVALHLPGEKERRVGQSVAAASLPEIKEL